MPNHAEQLAQELNLSLKNVQGAIDLIDAGNTIPFIARYRKEATGSMDDQVLRNLGDRLEYLRGLDKRKEEVTGSIEAGKSADFIVTRRNPLDDLTALRQLELVVCRGRAVHKPAPKRNKTVDALLDPYLA